MSLDPRIEGLAERIKSLEQWRDAVTQACFQAPVKTETAQLKQEFQRLVPKLDEQSTDVLSEFPEEVRGHLKVEGNMIRMEYVSSQKYSVIAEVAKKLGYRWVSAGKNSRWER